MDLEVAVGSRFQFPKVMCIFQHISLLEKSSEFNESSDFADHEIKKMIIV
jgi:hypothetical protein